MSLKSTLTISLLSFSLILAQSTQSIATTNAIPVSDSRVSIMAYNVENLFDNIDDPDHEDESYLSLAEKKKRGTAHADSCGARNKPGSHFHHECMYLDWSDSVIETKMNRIADTILSVNQIGADIVLMEEVENSNILHQLNSKYLKTGKFITEVILQGDDSRGINVALLSKYPLAGAPKIHRIPFNIKASAKTFASVEKPEPAVAVKTRGILQVDLKLPSGQILTVFGVHFPSQGKPTVFREQAVLFLNKLQQSLPPGRVSVVGGDFNIIEAEQALVKNQLASQWLVSHMIGCQSCEGTHKYKDHWSFLDILGFSKNSHVVSAFQFSPNAAYNIGTGMAVDADSIKVIKSGKFQLDGSGDPVRFDAGSPKGVSDHLPIYAELIYQ